MKTLRTASKVLVAGLLALALTPVAHAQATRTWVSGVGNDANPCSRTAPCKTFAGALVKTLAGGEISVLDPGGYGAVTINKAITIDGRGTLASILASATSGIIVNAGVNDKVTIRNISINGAGTTLGTNGIRYIAGAQLTVENVTIERFSNRGIDVALTASGKLFVKDTNIFNTTTGIRTTTTAGQVLSTIDNVRIEGMTTGIEVAGGNNIATVRNSVISGNTQNGILASGATSVVNVEDSMISYNNTNGVNASVSGASIRLSRSDIFNNQAGITFVVGATVASDGQNRIAGNGSSQAPNGPGTIVVQ
ncbi:MAG TPA: right-handed parallel beta-helix repeat-containing protein [Thermoanaerobaculia bacterium]|nr:right-handed parallel beta-helix repeat-containing protein [Thermoanaerobaculia bacterium]